MGLFSNESTVLRLAVENNKLLKQLLEGQNKIMAQLDNDTNAVQAVTASISVIDAEVKAMQKVIAAGGTPDTSGMDAAVAALQAAAAQLGQDAAPVSTVPITQPVSIANDPNVTTVGTVPVSNGLTPGNGNNVVSNTPQPVAPVNVATPVKDAPALVPTANEKVYDPAKAKT